MIRLAVIVAALASTAQAESNATRWLADEQIEAACDGRGGTIAPEGLVEIDLDADGRDDLILNHEDITCNGEWSRSQFCGVQACSILLYLRRDGLLVRADEILGAMLTIGTDTPPTLKGFAHGGAPWAVRWAGDGFELQ